LNIALFNTIVYLSGGVKYSVPNELSFTYILTQLRFLFISYIVSSYLELPYTVGIMAITVLLADFRFYQDFSNAVEESDDDSDL
jgi:hypothetical protein